MKKTTFLITTIAIFLLLNVSLKAQIFVFQPGSVEGNDTYVSSLNDSTNYGNDPYMFFGGVTFPQKDTFNLFIKFDLSSITPGTTITSARLDLNVKGQNGGMQGYQYGVYKVNQTWKEDSIYWYNQPIFDTISVGTFSGDYFQEGYLQSWRTIYIPDSIVQDWVNNPSLNNGLMIRSISGFYGHPMIASSDWTDSTAHPRLVLNSTGSIISGIISDSVSGNPLSGVIIAAYSKHGVFPYGQDTTDAYGNYQLDVLYPDSYTVKVSGITGYMPQILDSVIVTEGQNYVLGINLIPDSNAIAGVAGGTWSLANSPYIISGDIIVKDSTTLVIEPGVEIKFAGPFEIGVYGKLKAMGTYADSIIFTSYDTILEHKGRGIRFYEADSSKLEYCRIENMYSYDGIWGIHNYDMGGGIYSYNTNLTIQHCHIRKNFAQTGGGMYIVNYNNVSIINRNKIEDNIAMYNGCSNDGGGGVCLNSVDSYEAIFFNENLILNNEFIDPSCNNSEGGGGMMVLGGSYRIINNTLLYNKAKRGPAIFAPFFNGKILNNIFWFNNDGINNEQVALEDNNVGTNFEFSYNCIQDSGVIFQHYNIPSFDTVPGMGNIYLYPDFADTLAGNYGLNPSSPCIDNAYNHLLYSQYDFLDKCRVSDGDSNGSGIVDMGAYEYNANNYHYLDLGEGFSKCSDSTILAPPYYEHYTWSNGDTLNYTNITSSGEYYITVNNTLGCYAWDSVSVQIWPVPVPHISGDTLVCFGNTATFNVENGFNSYLWNNDTINGTEHYTTGVSGNYWVKVSNQYGCIGYSDTLHSDIVPIDEVNLGNDISLYLTESVILNAGHGYNHYSWNIGSNSQTVTIFGSHLGIGTHTIWVHATTTKGCFSADTIVITVLNNLGITNITDNEPMTVYPNPASTFIDITIPSSWNNQTNVTLADLTGRTIIQNVYSGTKNLHFDLPGIVPGLYQLILKSGDKYSFKKLVVE